MYRETGEIGEQREKEREREREREEQKHAKSLDAARGLLA